MRSSTRLFAQGLVALGVAAGLAFTTAVHVLAKSFKARQPAEVTQQIDQLIHQDLTAS